MVRKRSGVVANGKLDNLGLNGATGNLDPGHRQRQLEPTRPGAARIKKDHPIPLLDLRPVRMTGNHHMKPRHPWIEIEFLDNMQHVEQGTVNLEHLRLGDVDGPAALVGVAANDSNRCERA